MDISKKPNLESIEFTLLGRPASKKNSKRIFPNRRTGRIKVLSSVAYLDFEENALTQLLGTKRPRWTTPVIVMYAFYQKGKLSQDLDNAMASINDIMQKFGIFVDDKQIVGGAFTVTKKAKEWKTKVTVTLLQ